MLFLKREKHCAQVFEVRSQGKSLLTGQTSTGWQATAGWQGGRLAGWQESKLAGWVQQPLEQKPSAASGNRFLNKEFTTPEAHNMRRSQNGELTTWEVDILLSTTAEDVKRGIVQQYRVKIQPERYALSLRAANEWKVRGFHTWSPTLTQLAACKLQTGQCETAIGAFCTDIWSHVSFASSSSSPGWHDRF